MSSLLKNLMFALGLALILWLGYSIFSKDEEEELVSSQNEVVDAAASAAAQEFLGKLAQLKALNLDGEIFNDDRYLSLLNYRIDILETPTGRINPFAPTVENESELLLSTEEADVE